jgi:hypothetical protein
MTTTAPAADGIHSTSAATDNGTFAVPAAVLPQQQQQQEEEDKFWVTPESPLAQFQRLWPQLMHDVPSLLQQVTQIETLIKRKAWRLLSTRPSEPELKQILTFYNNVVPLSSWLNAAGWLQAHGAATHGCAAGALPELVPIHTRMLLRLFAFAKHYEEEREATLHPHQQHLEPLAQLMGGGGGGNGANAAKPRKSVYADLRFEAEPWEFVLQNGEKVHIPLTADLLHEAIQPDSKLFLRPDLLPPHFDTCFFDIRCVYSHKTHLSRVEMLSKQVNGKFPLRMLARQNGEILCSTDAGPLVQYFWRRYLLAQKSQEVTQGLHY